MAPIIDVSEDIRKGLDSMRVPYTLVNSELTATASASKEPVDFQNPDIVKHDYVQIPETGRLISKFELQGYNGMNWTDQNFKLHESGLYMPEVPEFMTHFKNVVDVYNSKGKKVLFDAAGNPVPEEELRDIYLHLTKNHIVAYFHGVEGAWTYLDAKFKQSDNEMYVLSGHRTQDAEGIKILVPTKTEKLEACLTEDSFADLDSVNRQGLLTMKSRKQKYQIGENVFFW